mmetsp:Transcript_31815/g.66206  ORF Transcript_31815/g.66206 Transcript_31815/m.66206 type:complete len:82 (-) Transcript_31815:63-308(-)
MLLPTTFYFHPAYTKAIAEYSLRISTEDSADSLHPMHPIGTNRDIITADITPTSLISRGRTTSERTTEPSLEKASGNVPPM